MAALAGGGEGGPGAVASASASAENTLVGEAHDGVTDSQMGEKQESDAQAASAAPSATANRWAALRGYISSTMEQNPAFARR
ncbi:hypothetical protein E4U41_001951 [Claviceps citrina]|nr:hypothetical protein E4U41_001951 [Claviceps citrina]